MEKVKVLKQQTISGFIWRLLQNSGTQVIGFVISIILARILTPDDYGLVAMITVFINISMVFITTGFTSAIVQRKEMTETEINTVFYLGVFISIVLYGILYVLSPAISAFYSEPLLCRLLRVNGIIIIIAAMYSVQQALITRNMEFRKSFLIGLLGIIAQGVTGIYMAYHSFGPWAIVGSSLANNIVSAVTAWTVVKWKPGIRIKCSAIKRLAPFSLKILLSSLLDSVFNNIRSLIIGRQYSSEDLAYYNRGYQFPSLIMLQIDGATSTVLFSSLSKVQDDVEAGLAILRRVMKTSLYVCLPLLAGLSAVARPMVILLLTDKWLPCVDYIYLTSIMCAFWPLSSCRQALNAKGKSGISLALNIINKGMVLILLLLTYRYSIKLMVISTIIANAIGVLIGMAVYSKELNYKIKHQLMDIMPPVLLSVAMGIIVYSVELLNLSNVVTLLIQVPLGIIIYILGSIIFKFESYNYLLNIIKSFISKRHSENPIKD